MLKSGAELISGFLTLALALDIRGLAEDEVEVTALLLRPVGVRDEVDLNSPQLTR